MNKCSFLIELFAKPFGNILAGVSIEFTHMIIGSSCVIWIEN